MRRSTAYPLSLAIALLYLAVLQAVSPGSHTPNDGKYVRAPEKRDATLQKGPTPVVDDFDQITDIDQLIWKRDATLQKSPTPVVDDFDQITDIDQLIRMPVSAKSAAESVAEKSDVLSAAVTETLEKLATDDSHSSLQGVLQDTPTTSGDESRGNLNQLDLNQHEVKKDEKTKKSEEEKEKANAETLQRWVCLSVRAYREGKKHELAAASGSRPSSIASTGSGASQKGAIKVTAPKRDTKLSRRFKSLRMSNKAPKTPASETPVTSESSATYVAEPKTLKSKLRRSYSLRNPKDQNKESLEPKEQKPKEKIFGHFKSFRISKKAPKTPASETPVTSESSATTGAKPERGKSTFKRILSKRSRRSSRKVPEDPSAATSSSDTLSIRKDSTIDRYSKAKSRPDTGGVQPEVLLDTTGSEGVPPSPLKLDLRTKARGSLTPLPTRRANARLRKKVDKIAVGWPKQMIDDSHRLFEDYEFKERQDWFQRDTDIQPASSLPSLKYP